MSGDAWGVVRTTYDQVAERGASEVCCSPVVIYDPEDLAALPAEALQMSSGCGNPLRGISIKPGSTVVDIGSGAGVDCVLAARATGPTGRVIGVDPSAKMRERAARTVGELGLDWVSFVDGTAERMPLPDASVDVVISNCVLSLALDPRRVWLEIARVLRPKGGFSVSDVVGGSRQETNVTKARCETGVEWQDYRRYLLEAGFTGIHVLSAQAVPYRDGKAVRSVTLSGRRSAGGMFVQLLHRGVDQAAVDRSVRDLAAVAERRDLDFDLEVLDLRDPGPQDILGLVTAGVGGRSTLPPSAVFVVVDGGLAGHLAPEHLMVS